MYKRQVLSNYQLLYSTLPQQKFRFEDFFAEQVVPSVYFTNAHQSYRRFESNQTFVSYIRKLPPFSPKSFYLVISLPASSFSNLLGSTAGTMGLCDSSGYTTVSYTHLDVYKRQVNCPGDLEDYFQLIQKDDRMCGGFVWEWCDHAIAHGKTESGKTIYYYGGDHDEDCLLYTSRCV